MEKQLKPLKDCSWSILSALELSLKWSRVTLVIFIGFLKSVQVNVMLLFYSVHYIVDTLYCSQ